MRCTRTYIHTKHPAPSEPEASLISNLSVTKRLFFFKISQVPATHGCWRNYTLIVLVEQLESRIKGQGEQEGSAEKERLMASLGKVSTLSKGAYRESPPNAAWRTSA